MNRTTRIHSKHLLLLGTLSLLASACGGRPDPEETILVVTREDPDLSTLAAALQKADLATMLNDPNQKFTLFAPTNAAFARLLSDLGISNGLDGLSGAQLRPILLYHVLNFEMDEGEAVELADPVSKVDALGGKVELSLDGSGKIVRFDRRSSMIEDDVKASNGLIHVIDAVILPSITDVVTTSPDFSSFVAAARAADTASPSPNLVATMDDDSAVLTVFAPNNAGFGALVSSLAGTDNGATTGINSLSSFRNDQLIPVLTYHVMPARVPATSVPPEVTAMDSFGGKLAVQRSGDVLIVDGVRVALADVYTSNGVIQMIDRVLLPSITDMVTTSGQLGALKNAVLAADFATTSPKVATALDGTTPYTLFAPSNAAFAALGATPEGQALTNLLLYHAATEAAPLYAATVFGLSAPFELDTAFDGRSVQVFSEGTDGARVWRIADTTATPASVIATNYFASNGVIQLIDRVLIPNP